VESSVIQLWNMQLNFQHVIKLTGAHAHAHLSSVVKFYLSWYDGIRAEDTCIVTYGLPWGAARPSEWCCICLQIL